MTDEVVRWYWTNLLKMQVMTELVMMQTDCRLLLVTLQYEYSFDLVDLVSDSVS